MQLYVFCSDELVKLYFEKYDNFEKNNIKLNQCDATKLYV